VRISDMDDGMVIQPIDVALRPIGMPPIRTLQELPPFAPIFQIDRTVRRREYQRAGVKHVRQRAGIVFWIRGNFGECLMSGGADEFLKLPVGHWRTVDPEAADSDAMDRRFFWIMFVRSHAERAAGNPDHVPLRRLLARPFYRRTHHSH